MKWILKGMIIERFERTRKTEDRRSVKVFLDGPDSFCQLGLTSDPHLMPFLKKKRNGLKGHK